MPRPTSRSVGKSLVRNEGDEEPPDCPLENRLPKVKFETEDDELAGETEEANEGKQTEGGDVVALPIGHRRLSQMILIRDEEFPDLFRGVRVSQMLNCFGYLFSNQRVATSSKAAANTQTFQAMGGEELYHFSRPVTNMLDAFVSHSWSSPRWKKFLTLAVFFRVRRAVVVSNVAVLLVFLAMLAGWRPGTVLGPVPHYNAWDSNGLPRSAVCFWVGQVTFYVVLLIGWERLWGGGETCFLDKVCIHQVDVPRKMAGVHSLGGFVAQSRRMVVLWSERYFSRLWCVFELACMVVTHGGQMGVVDFCPLSFGVLVVCMRTVCTFNDLFLLVVRNLYGFEEHDESALLFSPWVIIVWVLGGTIAMGNLWHGFFFRAVDVRELRGQVLGFRSASAECFDESDRPIVTGCIEGWYGDAEVFDRYVREQLGPKIISQHGRRFPLLPLMWTFYASHDRLWSILDVIPFNLDRPAELFQTCMVLVHGQGRTVFFTLLASALMFLHVWLRQRGWHVVLNCCVGVPLLAGGFMVWGHLLGAVLLLAKTWPSQLLVCVLVNGLLLCGWWRDIGQICRSIVAASRRTSLRE